MNKSEIILRICELDPTCRLGMLVNFSQEDLQYHLQVLLSQSPPGAAQAETHSDKEAWPDAGEPVQERVA